MSGKVLLVAVLLVGVASRCSSGSRGLQGDHVAEQKYGGGGYGGGGSGGGYGGGGGGGGGGYGGGGYGSGGYTPMPVYSGTGTCDYWKSHPDAIVSCIGSLGSILGSLGDVCSAFFGSKLQTLQDALCNTRTDCYGDLLREGAAAYLNSVAAKQQYAYSTQQVKDCIAVALTSKAAAVAQAAMFKKANYACHY
ncbi:protodermal factor 1-like [Miscanthus floridulus]|uniref:protodermal factor 1-like n=1 Tax=Miscanthus floridulus TaxID=154761 RepID=UPI003459FDE2